MRAVGLITEYNPFHMGHEYHMIQAKKISGADIVIAVMSGNFVQRGVPAMYDKWKRSQAAVQNGVDLIVELPVAFSIQSGYFFAKGAIEILLSLGVDTIVFGAEHAQWDFIYLAQIVKNATIHENEFRNYKQTYASNFNMVLMRKLGITINEPNDMLGLNYALAILELGVKDRIQLKALKRKGSNYHTNKIENGVFASASGIRNVLKKGLFTEQLLQNLPNGTQKLLIESPLLEYEELMWILLRYKVLTTPIEQLENIYQLNNGLAYRLLKIVEKNAQTEIINWEIFMQQFKSKRYTYSRISRSILYTLLNIEIDEMNISLKQPYIRPLAFNDKGKLWLKRGRNKFLLPVIGKVDKNDLKGVLKLDLRAGRLYNMLKNKDNNKPQDIGRKPYYE